MSDYSLVPVDYQPDFGDDVPLGSADEVSRKPQSLYEPTQPPLQSPNSTQSMAMETNQFPGDTANMEIRDVSGWSKGGTGPVAQNDGPYRAPNADSDAYVNQVGHFETPVNPNQAFGELQSIQEAAPEKTISGTDYVSGVRDGQVARNSDDSIDVTNGTVVTLSYATGQAQTVTVTNTDIAHIDLKTGRVTIQKPL